MNNLVIADSKNAEFTHTVVAVPQDIETLLGITSPGSSHRKPQHLLYSYATNRVDMAAIEYFCNLVQSCFKQ